ncbi:MAG: tetratricopeptide repeat protein [Anaerolineales bacterium]|nr:tetratricopeptide repeat protein [Anaerolineales bacterium]
MSLHPPGSLIANRYEVIARPLVGRTSVVYLCHDREKDCPIVLKSLTPALQQDKVSRQAFHQAGEGWQGLGAHPNLVQCHQLVRISYARDDYLMLDLVARQEGEQNPSLRAWLIGSNPLVPAQVLLFALQIAHGMHHASQMVPGFVHGDLRPENILIGADHLLGSNTNRVRVTDFYLSGVATDRPKHYLAPECWDGAPPSPAADIYAVGCILYEMLAGKPFAPADSDQEIEQAHRSGLQQPLPVDWPADLSALVRICLATNPSNRYTDWAALEDALQSAYARLSEKPAPASQAAAVEDTLSDGWGFCELGIACLEAGKIPPALVYFERAGTMGRTLADLHLQATALHQTGQAHALQGDHHQAVVEYQQALDLYRQVGNQRSEGALMGNLGQAYADLGDTPNAIDCLEKSLQLSRQTNNRRVQAKVLDLLGLVYQSMGDSAKAVGSYEQALHLHRQLNDPANEAVSLGNMGNTCRELGEPARAADYYQQALELHRQIGDTNDTAIDLSLLGLAYAEMGDIPQAIIFFNQRLEIARQFGEHQSETIALGNLGEAHLELGDPHRAIDLFEQALSIDRKLNDTLGESISLVNLSNAYLELGDANRAVDTFEVALKTARQAKNERSESEALCGLGRAYIQLGDGSKGRDYANQALQIANQQNNRRGQADALSALGTACIKLNENEQAQRQLEQALEIRRQTGDNRGLGRDSLTLAQFLLQIGQPERALSLAQQAHHIYSQMGHETKILKARAIIDQVLTGEPLPIAPPTNVDAMLDELSPFIGNVIAAAFGNRFARTQVEEAFNDLQQKGWNLAEPIRLILEGERNSARLTSGLNENEALIVREILKQL